MFDVKKAIDEAILVLEELPCQTERIERVTHGLRQAWDAAHEPEPAGAVEIALRRAARAVVLECGFVLGASGKSSFEDEAREALAVLREELGMPPREQEFFARNDVNRLMSMIVAYGAQCHEHGMRLGEKRADKELSTMASWTDKRKEALLGDIRVVLHALLGQGNKYDFQNKGA